MKLREVRGDLPHDTISLAVLHSADSPEFCKSLGFCDVIDTNFPNLLSLSPVLFNPISRIII
jgi:hypothetical protein